MNKARRVELRRLKFKKRLELRGIHPDENGNLPGNFNMLRSHSTPCSCSICRDEKYSRKQKHPNQEEE